MAKIASLSIEYKFTEFRAFFCESCRKDRAPLEFVDSGKPPVSCGHIEGDFVMDIGTRSENRTTSARLPKSHKCRKLTSHFYAVPADDAPGAKTINEMRQEVGLPPLVEVPFSEPLSEPLKEAPGLNLMDAQEDE